MLVINSILCAILLLARDTVGFSGTSKCIKEPSSSIVRSSQSQHLKRHHQTQRLAAADGKDNDVALTSKSGGAGAWRDKAKEFKKNANAFVEDDSDRMLNIAFVTGNAMKQKEINAILSNHGATSSDGSSFVNLRILDVDLPEIQGEFSVGQLSFPVLFR